MRAAPAGADRFAGLDWEFARGGVPLLTDALATLRVGDHHQGPPAITRSIVGRVDDLPISPTGDPLVFFAGAFGTVQSRV